MSPAISRLLSFYRQGGDLESLVDGLCRLVGTGTLTEGQILAQIRLFLTGFPLDGAVVNRLESEFDRRHADPDATVFVRTVGDLREGDVVKGRYLLESEIGRGGMSRVFKALDWQFFLADDRDHRLAIKFMDVAGVQVDPDHAFKLMQREAKRTRTLRHDNIIQVFDFDRDEGLPYVTMELLEGESLEKRIGRLHPGAMPMSTALHVIAGMCDGLHYAHGKGFVHADFKPGNVFITDDDVVKVIDFGIARVLRVDGAEGHTTRFQAEGALTPPYASPEMFLGEAPDVRDDIFALGLVAYEAVTGVHPFDRKWSIHARHENAVPQLVPQLSPGQWTTLTAAMSFEREARPKSAEKFKKGLLESSPAATVAAPRDMTSEGPRPRGGWVRYRLYGLLALLVVAVGLLLLRVSGVPLPGLSTPAECAGCEDFVRIPQGTSGEVGMSRPAALGVYEYPMHLVSLSKTIFFGKREVTVADFNRFASEYPGNLNGCGTPESDWKIDPNVSWIQPGFAQTDAHPVTCVSWNDASAYAAWLSRTTGEYYRLPSEAEWELAATRYTGASLEIDEEGASACRSSNVADLSTLSTFPGLGVVRCYDDHIYTAAVDRGGTDEVSDMRGNVFEWTQDCWNDNYLNAPRNGSAVMTGNCRQRVLRGGSWYSGPEQQRLTFRNRADANLRTNTFGFRLVREE